MIKPLIIYHSVRGKKGKRSEVYFICLETGSKFNCIEVRYSTDVNEYDISFHQRKHITTDLIKVDNIESIEFFDHYKILINSFDNNKIELVFDKNLSSYPFESDKIYQQLKRWWMEYSK